MTDTQLASPEASPAPGSERDRYNYTFSPVTVSGTGGMAFLGTIAIILLVALLRALARNRACEVQLARQSPVA